MNKELFLRFIEGDEDAVCAVIELYYPGLYSVVFALLDQHEEAQDVVNESLTKLYQRRKSLDISRNIEHYLYQIAHHAAISRLRKRNSQRAASQMLERLADRLYEDPKEGERDRVELIAIIKALIADLPPRRKLIVELFFGVGMEDGSLDIREIAERLNLAESTVRNQRNHALDRLREALRKKDK